MVAAVDKATPIAAATGGVDGHRVVGDAETDEEQVGGVDGNGVQGLVVDAGDDVGGSEFEVLPLNKLYIN